MNSETKEKLDGSVNHLFSVLYAALAMLAKPEMSEQEIELHKQLNVLLNDAHKTNLLLKQFQPEQ